MAALCAAAPTRRAHAAMLRPLTRWDMKEGHTYAAPYMQENRAHLSIQEMTKSRVVPRFSWQFSHAKPQTAHRLAQTSAKKKSPPHHHCPLTAYAARRTHTAHCAPLFAIVFHGPPLPHRIRFFCRPCPTAESVSVHSHTGAARLVPRRPPYSNQADLWDASGGQGHPSRSTY